MSGRAQTSAENAKYLRMLSQTGKNKKEIERECRAKYDRSCTVALDLSYLNPTGSALVNLNLAKRDTEHFREQETMAQWIGKLRGQIPELSDSHENEIYEYLKDNYRTSGKKFTSSAQFLEFMRGFIERRSTFGQIDARLNFGGFTPQPSAVLEYDERIARAEKELRDAEKKFKQKTIEAEERRAKGEITKEQIDKNLQKYTDEILIAQRELLRLRAERDQNIHTAKEQEITLFGLGGDSLKSSIRNLITRTLNETKKNENDWLSLGQITNKQKNDILKLGIDISDFKENIIDQSFIRHVFKRHSDEKIELSRNQLPITENDIILIPDIINNYDDIEKTLEDQKSKNQKKGFNIIYTKRINGQIFVIVEVRRKRKKLAIKTMWKKRVSPVLPDMPESISDTEVPTYKTYRAYPFTSKNNKNEVQNQAEIFQKPDLEDLKQNLLEYS